MDETTRMLREALDRVAPVGRHAIVLGEALRNAGLLDVPADRAEFRAFAEGPLLHAAKAQLGDESGRQLISAVLQLLLPGTSTLSGTLPLNAPSSGKKTGSAPTGRISKGGGTLAYGALRKGEKDAERTLPYTGDEQRPRIDVAMLEPDPAVAAHVTAVLERRGYRVFSPTLDSLVALCQQVTIRLVFVGGDHAEVLATVQTLGADAPEVVFLSDDIKQRPKGVVAILPRDARADLIEAIDAAVRFTDRK